MNWIYHIDLETTDLVDDETYAELLKSPEWFATPTLARRANEIAIAQLNEPEIEEIEPVEEVEEIKPAKPRKVKANGNNKRANS